MRTRLPLLALLLGLAAPRALAQDLYDPTQLRQLDLVFHDANWWSLLKQYWPGGPNILADLTVDGVTYPDVGVRIKGNSSYFFLPPGSKKVSFNVEVDHTHPDQRVYGVRTVNLNNGIEDPTFCREVTYMNFLRRYSPGGRGNHVVLTCNGEDWGVYANAQQYNKDMLEEFFRDEDGVRWKCPNNPNGPGLSYLGANYGPYQGQYEVRDDGGLADPWLPLVDVCDALSNEPLATWENIDAVFSVDAALWTVALENLFMDEDSYISKGADFNVYRDPLDGRSHLHQHDGNESFGVSLFGWPGGTHWELAPLFNKNDTQKPVLNRLLDVPELQQRYLAHMRTLLEEFRWDLIEPGLLDAKAMLDAAVAADTKKIYTYQDFLDNFTQTVVVNSGAGGNLVVPGLKEFVEGRRTFLLAHGKIDNPAPEIPWVLSVPERPAAADAVHVVARVDGPQVAVGDVTLYYRDAPGRFLPVPMADDGASGDGAAGDGVYGALLPVTGADGAVVEYYVGAASKTAVGAMTFHPRRTEFAPLTVRYAWGTTGLKITELLYSGVDGEFVELTNTSAAPLDLTGWSLDDQSGDPGTVDLSPAGTLAPGASVVVTAADPATFAAAWGVAPAAVLGPNLEAPFGRNDQVNVFDAAGVLVERLTYGDEDLPGSPRAKDESANACDGVLGADDVYRWTLAELGDAWGSWTSTGGDVGNPGAFAGAACPGLGEEYCASNANSTGVPGRLSADGSALVADNDVTFHALALPANKFGYLLMSDVQGFLPFFAGSQGNLCLGGKIVRFAQDVLDSGPDGAVDFTPDLTALPQGTVIQPGQTWSFQLWFRDANPTPTSNTTSGVAIQFL